MKTLFAFVGKRWFLSLLGTLALAVLVWLAGDLIGIGGRVPLASPSARLAVMAALFGTWGLWQIGSAVRARLRNRRLVDQLAASRTEDVDPAQAASAEELQLLEERFRDALGLLRRSETRHRLGGRWLYQLPWYLIIGPPGCGKTTALLNAGLRFPLVDRVGKDPIQGVGGTRNCDWWFAEDAVLLDTAGRYTTQDSYQQVDSNAWLGFLGMLKKHRPRRPINGVLVAVSLADLLQQSPTERAAHAQAIRQRLQELYTRFKIRFPVYVLFMKADLVAGFMEYFADLGKEQREQVWGTTLRLDDEGVGMAPVEGLRDALDALLVRLSQRRLARLQAERDAHKRSLIFAFPEQFAALTEPVDDFVRAVFTPSRYEVRPLLRGVYFTSGTQTGTPIDRVLAGIAASFGLSRQGPQPFDGTGRGYFLARLFRDLVFPEAGLAGLNPRLERRRRWLRNGAYASAIGLTLLAAAAWTTSYSRNKAYTQTVDQALLEIDAQIDALGPVERDPIALLPLLDAARTIPGGYADRDRGAPLLSRLGLYQGEKLGPEAERAYQRILRKTLLPSVMLRLEDQIREAGGDPDFLYDALRIYLMLDTPAHYDAESIQYWVGRDWERNLPRANPAQQRESLKDHLQALLEQRPAPLPLALDANLIARSREIINRVPLAERIYERLQRDGLGLGFPDFTVSEAAGDYAKLVFQRRSGRSLNDGIPALYTYEGYHQGFARQALRLVGMTAEEAWILGSSQALTPGSEPFSRLLEDVRSLYLRDYVAAWNDLLQDIDLVPPRDLHHAAEIARVLADKDQSPLRRLLTAVATQTRLDRSAEGDQDETPGPGSASGFLQRVDRYFGGESQIAEIATEEAPEAYVTRRFRWLYDLMIAPEGQAPPFDKALEALDQMNLYLKSVGTAASAGRGVLAAGESAEIAGVRQVAGELPDPVSRLLTTLAQDSADIVSGGMRAQLNRLWTAEVLPFCREAIHDRYPFDRDSPRETTLHDFGRMFGPGGLLDAFFKENLGPLADTSGPQWRWIGSGIGIPEEVLAQFQRAAVIREAFFLSGGKLPSIQFDLTPRALDAEIKQFILDLGGQIVDYRQGPMVTYPLQWPSPTAPGRVRMVFVDTLGARPTLTFSGPWAWFRLLDTASIRATSQQELFRVGFQLAGHNANFDLRAVSVRNPFNLNALRGFRCPDRL
ncbi:type VI secretion system membrane subunit TssM [Thiohalocapsa marina]|uniref:Type VI secretion system membrane subunit TssM n=1 Tax=Thiohalocapsa marina TaxID=424902 RepID=A0A5M8FUD6_9GAMM|nr:type VI secretion system membrane subunit TssM [Thiohalocapsa marina]KAA6187359.1 type VI secretion system membrane subunit TssM [Thiohalocapsa marina]